MFKKMKSIKYVRVLLFIGIGLFCASLVIAQSTGIYNQVNQEGYRTYLTVSVALLLTFLTFFIISLLARYLRETANNSYNGFDDSDC